MTFWRRRLLALLSAAVMLVALTSPALADSTHVHKHHNDVDDSFNTDNSQDNDTIVGNNTGNNNDPTTTTNNDSHNNTEVATDVTTAVCSTGAVIGTLDCHGSS